MPQEFSRDSHDEIQNVERWEKAINSFKASISYKIGPPRCYIFIDKGNKNRK